VERGGLPLAAGLTGANRHDSTAFAPLLDVAVPDAGGAGVARRPAKPHADKGACRAARQERGIADRIARRGIEDKRHLGRHRWALAWLARYRRLTIRYERHESLHQAFLDLACALICLNALTRL